MKEFAPFRLDVEDQSLWRDDRRVPLTPKAFAVLQFLVERAGRLVSQTELLEALWPDTFVQPEVLKSQILDIRGALGDRPKDPLFIETVPRRGYRFIAPVRDARPAAAAPAEPEPAAIVGRDVALEELRNALNRAENGERQIVWVTGEQGMGKTTLVETFLRQTGAAGVELARGQCLEGYGAVKEPYYPVLEALGQLARGAQSKRLQRVLEAHAPTWLIQLPALLTREHRDTLQRELLGATRERMIREICEAFERLTEEITLVLLLEDLHWTDHSTVDLLSAVAQRRFPARLLVIGTYRPVDLVLSQHPLKQVSHYLKSHRQAREVALSPLAEIEVGEYLSRQTGRVDTDADPVVPQLARWIRKQTEGNPLFMVTVVQHLLETGHVQVSDTAWTVATPLDQIEVSIPDTLRQMIELQIERLSPREQLTLSAASVHGIEFSVGVTASALEIEEDSIEDTCEKLARENHIIRTASAEQLADGTFSQRYEFVHAVFRGVIYHRLAPARRAKLHRRIGEKIESLYPGDRAEVAAELAGHFQQCADWARAFDYLKLAARRAWRRLAYRDARSILELALQAAGKMPEAERGPAEIRMLDSLTILQQAMHDVSGVIPTLETLAARAAAGAMPDVEVRALTAAAALKGNEDSRVCRPLLDRLDSLASRQKDRLSQAQARVQCASMRLSLTGWDARVAEESEADVVRVLEAGDPIASAPVLMDHAYAQWARSRYAESLGSVQTSLPALLESGRLVRFLHGRDLMAVNHAFLGQWGSALDTLEESMEDAHRNDAPFRLLMPLLFKAWVHLNAMDFAGVSEMCDRALASLSGPFMRDRRRIAQQLAASATLGLGRQEEARRQLAELRDEVDECPVVFSWYWRMPLQVDLVSACLAAGDVSQARIEAGRLLDLTQQTEEHTWRALAWEASARVALEEVDGERAERDVARAIEEMEGFEVPLAAWRVHATAAVMYGRTGHREQERLHREVSRRALQSLADSLETRPELRRTFVSSPEVAGLIGESSRSQALGAT